MIECFLYQCRRLAAAQYSAYILSCFPAGRNGKCATAPLFLVTGQKFHFGQFSQKKAENEHVRLREPFAFAQADRLDNLSFSLKKITMSGEKRIFLRHFAQSAIYMPRELPDKGVII
ncbi:MAG TPA: hypothetical protein IAB92_03070 [Candidatus Faecousia faecigallinarum]|nr:hypothetical protein [Candidatus Faecousia faecigallinarum]